MNRHHLGYVLLVGVLVVSGCAAPPVDDAETGSDVRVDVSSDHDRAYVITLGVAPAGHTGLAVELANGTVRRYPDARGIGGIPEAVVPRVVSLRPFGDGVETRIYRWDSPQGASAHFANVPRNATVFYSVAFPSGPEPMRTLGRLSCGRTADMTAVTLRINDAGSVTVSNDCRLDAVGE